MLKDEKTQRKNNPVMAFDRGSLSLDIKYILSFTLLAEEDLTASFFVAGAPNISPSSSSSSSSNRDRAVLAGLLVFDGSGFWLKFSIWI